MRVISSTTDSCKHGHSHCSSSGGGGGGESSSGNAGLGLPGSCRAWCGSRSASELAAARQLETRCAPAAAAQQAAVAGCRSGSSSSGGRHLAACCRVSRCLAGCCVAQPCKAWVRDSRLQDCVQQLGMLSRGLSAVPCSSRLVGMVQATCCGSHQQLHLQLLSLPLSVLACCCWCWCFPHSCRASMRGLLLGVVLTIGAQLLLVLLLRTLWARRALVSLENWLQRTFGMSVRLSDIGIGSKGSSRGVNGTAGFRSSGSDRFGADGGEEDAWGQNRRTVDSNGRSLSRADSDASSSSSTPSGEAGCRAYSMPPGCLVFPGLCEQDQEALTLLVNIVCIKRADGPDVAPVLSLARVLCRAVLCVLRQTARR